MFHHIIEVELMYAVCERLPPIQNNGFQDSLGGRFYSGSQQTEHDIL